MSETYMPLWNIYEIEEKEGTFALTDVLKTVLANAEILRVKYHILAREYEIEDSGTYGTPTASSDEATVSIPYTMPTKDTYYFIGENYKLTFTSSTYTLTKI